MRPKYQSFQRASGVVYFEDTITRQQESLKTKGPMIANRLLHAKNEAHVHSAVNLQIAQANLSSTDPAIQRMMHFLGELNEAYNSGLAVMVIIVSAGNPSFVDGMTEWLNCKLARFKTLP